MDKVYIVSETKINEVIKLLENIEARLQDKTDFSALGEWISEADARKILGRGKSWFHYMRKRGYFTVSKMGSTVYLKKDDIIEYLETHQKKAFRK